MIFKFKEISSLIYKFILYENSINYKTLKSNYDNYMQGKFLTLKNIEEQSYPHLNSILDSLLSFGYIEYGYRENELIFFIPKFQILKYDEKYYKKSPFLLYYTQVSESDEYIELQPLKLLKSLQSVEDFCSCLKDSKNLDYSFMYLPNNKKLEQYNNEKSYYDVGIYKQQLFSTSDLIMENKAHKRIPRRSENYDSLNYCFCYIDIHFKNKIFTYNKSHKVLKVNSIFLPTLIKRALYMCDIFSYLQEPSDKYSQYRFKNISEEIINELIRIFSINNIEWR